MIPRILCYATCDTHWQEFGHNVSTVVNIIQLVGGLFLVSSMLSVNYLPTPEVRTELD